MVHFPEDSHGAVCRRLATVVSVPPAPLAKRYKLDDRIDRFLVPRFLVRLVRSVDSELFFLGT